MLKQSAPIILVIGLLFILLEAFRAQHPRFQFGWLGVFCLGLYVLLASVVPVFILLYLFLPFFRVA